MDAKWTDKVQSGKPVTANFNGTVVTAQIGKEQEIGSDELLSKWGVKMKMTRRVSTGLYASIMHAKSQTM